MNAIYKYVSKASTLVLLSTLLIVGCLHEDDHEQQHKKDVNTKQNSITKMLKGKDVPLVLDFIKSKSNQRMEFTIDDSSSPEGQFRSHEENLSLTTTLTEQIKEVTNGYGNSNYTFKLEEEQSKEGVYFLNLVVKEFRDDFYLYIIKYVPDVDWLKSYGDLSDFSSFTGTMYYYSDEGLYLLKVEMINGTSTSITKHPCPDEGNEEENSEGSDSSDNGNSTGGGGDPTDNPNNEGNGNIDDPNNNGGSDGNPWGDVNNPDGNGGSCDLVIETTCVSHDPGEECEEGMIETHYWDCSGVHSPNPVGSSTDPFSTFLRHPCNPNGCPAENDCEYGWDENCNCLDEPEDGEEENSDIGVLIDLEAIAAFIEQLNEIFGEGNYEFDNSLTDEETINLESVDDIEPFLESLTEENFHETSSSMLPGSIRDDILTLEFSSFPEANFIANIRVMVPDDNNDLECLQLISLDTTMEGNISLFDWTQTSPSDPQEIDGPFTEINEEYDFIKFTVYGDLVIGFDVFDLPKIRSKKRMRISIYYRYSSGELLPEYSLWAYLNN